MRCYCHSAFFILQCVGGVCATCQKPEIPDSDPEPVNQFKLKSAKQSAPDQTRDLPAARPRPAPAPTPAPAKADEPAPASTGEQERIKSAWADFMGADEVGLIAAAPRH